MQGQPDLTTPEPTDVIPQYPTGRTKEPLRIFTAGDYGGADNWPVERLQQVVDNWNKFQKPGSIDPRFAESPAVYLSPDAIKGIQKPVNSVGVGHEDDQAYLRWLLDRTDIPSGGWPTSLTLDGDALYAELDGVPEELAALVNGGQIPYCSCEFHHDYIDSTGEHHGPTLRRIAFIGAEPPRSKGNGRFGPDTFVYSDKPTPGISSRLPLISVFTESGAMDRQAMLNKLASCGMDISKIDASVSDDVLAEICKTCDAKAATSGAAGGAGAVSANTDDDTNTNPNATATDDPSKKASEFSGSDEIRGKNKAGQIRAMWHNSPDGGPGYHSERKPADAATFSERQLHAAIQSAVAPLHAQINTLTAQVNGANRSLQAVNSTIAADRREADRATITTFCERMVREGRLEPSRLDPRCGPTEVDMILKLDSGTVAKFGEKQTTERQAYMDQLASRQPIRVFSERMEQPYGGSPNGMPTEQRRKELLGMTNLGQRALKAETAGVKG